MRLAAFVIALALAGCATQTPFMVEQVGQNREVLVRWNSETTSREAVDAQARSACGAAAQFLATEQRHDGFSYARYRCGS